MREQLITVWRKRRLIVIVIYGTNRTAVKNKIICNHIQCNKSIFKTKNPASETVITVTILTRTKEELI
jgi:hypothetical protein